MEASVPGPTPSTASPPQVEPTVRWCTLSSVLNPGWGEPAFSAGALAGGTASEICEKAAAGRCDRERLGGEVLALQPISG